jgi:plasmid stabilization system protein ParE
MKLVLRPYVEREIEDAAEWYETRQPGLREAFLDEVEAAFGRIRENPHLYAINHRKIRRALLRRFP